MVPRLLVSVSVDGVSSSSWLILDWLQFEWVQVYNPCRVKTIRIAASSIMDNPTLLLLLLGGENYTYSCVLGHRQPYSSVALIR
jgi:hypothetical protein